MERNLINYYEIIPLSCAALINDKLVNYNNDDNVQINDNIATQLARCSQLKQSYLCYVETYSH